jgi:hypothetical protein
MAKQMELIINVPFREHIATSYHMKIDVIVESENLKQKKVLTITINEIPKEITINIAETYVQALAKYGDEPAEKEDYIYIKAVASHHIYDKHIAGTYRTAVLKTARFDLKKAVYIDSKR